jgi:hypothetical protein
MTSASNPWPGPPNHVHNHLVNDETRRHLQALPIFNIPDDTESVFQHLLDSLAGAEKSAEDSEQSHRPKAI